MKRTSITFKHLGIELSDSEKEILRKEIECVLNDMYVSSNNENLLSEIVIGDISKNNIITEQKATFPINALGCMTQSTNSIHPEFKVFLDTKVLLNADIRKRVLTHELTHVLDAERYFKELGTKSYHQMGFRFWTEYNASRSEFKSNSTHLYIELDLEKISSNFIRNIESVFDSKETEEIKYEYIFSLLNQFNYMLLNYFGVMDDIKKDIHSELDKSKLINLFGIEIKNIPNLLNNCYNSIEFKDILNEIKNIENEYEIISSNFSIFLSNLNNKKAQS